MISSTFRTANFSSLRKAHFHLTPLSQTDISLPFDCYILNSISMRAKNAPEERSRWIDEIKTTWPRSEKDDGPLEGRKREIESDNASQRRPRPRPSVEGKPRLTPFLDPEWIDINIHMCKACNHLHFLVPLLIWLYTLQAEHVIWQNRDTTQYSTHTMNLMICKLHQALIWFYRDLALADRR